MFSINSNNLMNRFSLLLIVSFLFISSGYSQDIVVNTASRGVYNFIDELTVSRIIDANTTVKPYSRRQIGEWLLMANGKKDELSNRQRKELDFYLKDYYKDITGYIPKKKRFDTYYYTDSNFSITVNPIIGAYAYKNSNDMAYGRYSGAEVYGRIGKGWGYYVNLRDSYESIPLRSESLLTQQRGAVVKKNKSDGSIDFNEINGGISYSWNWGSLSLIKDNVEWGSGYNGTNIFSGHSPSFAMVKLKVSPVKWLDFSYFHGWLVSNVIDSSTISKSNVKPRWEYYGKYIAANMATIRPTKWLDFSIGSSVIYSYRTPQLPYFIPIMFFKAVDHWYSNLTDNTDQNSQMFLDLKVRPVKGLSLYCSFFVDEIGISRMFDSNNSTNFTSIKGGFNLLSWPLKNVGIISEYTKSNPYAYNHWCDVQTFATNKSNMGHYLRDNADEFFGRVYYKPLKNLNVSIEYISARKGADYRLLSTKYASGDWFMREVRWQRKAIIGSISYQPINDLYINLSIENSNITGPDVNLYTPKFQQGKTTTVFGGFSFGF
jgi:hypothetical protein